MNESVFTPEKTLYARQALIDIYLNYINNYLTVSTFAEHNGMTKKQGMELLTMAKQVFDAPHPDA
jgi:hypothetical protein